MDQSKQHIRGRKICIISFGPVETTTFFSLNYEPILLHARGSRRGGERLQQPSNQDINFYLLFKYILNRREKKEEVDESRLQLY
jgi:hypothetical protein